MHSVRRVADVVSRHESLRTLFPAHQGTPRQVVVPVDRADFGWHVVDATAWPAEPAGRRRQGGDTPHL